MIMATGELREIIHRLLDNPRTSVIEAIYRFPRLKVYVGILRRSSNHWMVRRQRTCPVLPDALLVNHRSNGFPRERFDLGDFVRRPKPVEEEQERDTRLECRRVRDQR